LRCRPREPRFVAPLLISRLLHKHAGIHKLPAVSHSLRCSAQDGTATRHRLDPPPPSCTCIARPRSLDQDQNPQEGTDIDYGSGGPRTVTSGVEYIPQRSFRTSTSLAWSIARAPLFGPSLRAVFSVSFWPEALPPLRSNSTAAGFFFLAMSYEHWSIVR
jgi:hypothetical protein